MPDTYFVDSNLFVVLETKVQGYVSRIFVELARVPISSFCFYIFIFIGF